MTSASDILQNSRAASEIAPLRAKWGWIVTLGAVYVIVGFIALGSIVVATGASVLVVGRALLGVLYVVAGFVTFENPLLAAALLTLVLGTSLVASGIMRIILAFSMRRETPWIWVAVSGIITLLLGLLILAHWPINSVYILGLLLGIDLIIAGAGWIGPRFGFCRGRRVCWG